MFLLCSIETNARCWTSWIRNLNGDSFWRRPSLGPKHCPPCDLVVNFLYMGSFDRIEESRQEYCLMRKVILHESMFDALPVVPAKAPGFRLSAQDENAGALPLHLTRLSPPRKRGSRSERRCGCPEFPLSRE